MEVLLAAREVFWFGFLYKARGGQQLAYSLLLSLCCLWLVREVDALGAVLCFTAVCAWRLSSSQATPSASSKSYLEVQAPEIPAPGQAQGCLEYEPEAYDSWEDMPKFPMLYDVKGVGPPGPLSFGCWISLAAQFSELAELKHIERPLFGLLLHLFISHKHFNL